MIVKETGLSEDKVTEIFPKSFFINKTMRQIICAMDKVNEQFESIEIKPGVKAHPQLLKLIVITKRLGVSHDKIIAYIERQIKTLDRFYLNRLLPVIVLNPKTQVLDTIEVEVDRYKSYIIDCNEIDANGLCKPVIYNSATVGDSNKMLKSNIERMLSLLGC